MTLTFDDQCRVDAVFAAESGERGKTFADCKNRFDNFTVFFAGFPFVPAPSVDWFDQPFDFAEREATPILIVWGAK